jgi:putative membrane protein
MTATQSNLAGLSRFIFRAPSWYTSVAFALLLAAVAGIGAFERPETSVVWRGVLFVGRDAWEGVFFIGIPTVVAGLATAWVDRLVGGKLTPNRSSLLALVCEVVIVAFLAVGALVAYLTPLGQPFVFDVLVVALASVFAMRLLVVMAVSRSSILVATVPASIQTVVAAVLLFVYSGTLRVLEVGGPFLDTFLMPYLARPEEAPPELSAISPDHFVVLALTCALYAAAVWTFLYVVDRPWRNTLGVSVLDFLRGFIGHIAEGTRELEDFFEQLGEEAVVPVTVLSIRTADGDEKARWVLPMIHPGPMGEIGGGNLPVRVAESTEGLAFPPHATAGHDFNLVTEREVDTVVEAATRAHERLAYSDQATESVRTTAGEASLLGQAFDDDGLLVSAFAPGFADDVEYAVGLSTAAEARTEGLDDVLLVDAHNSNNGLDGPDLGHVTPGSTRSFDMMQAARRAGEQLAVAPCGDLSVGVAWEPTDWTPKEGIGPLGIRAMVTDVAAGENADPQTTAYVLVDGNNMEPGLRGHLVDAVLNAVDADEAEVMTTDTHIVNTVEADNQVGAVVDRDALTDVVVDVAQAAAADTEPAEAGMATEHAEVTVFGNDRTESLASHANAAVSMGGALAAAVILASLAISVLLFFVTGA